MRDNGIGIPADVLPRVFDLFTQADRTLERAQGGLGIGLALVRKLVELHGGTVEARSEGPGRGSEFTVTLPLPPDATSPDPESNGRAAQSPSPVARPYRILVVDDNVDGANSLALLLRYTGHEVRTAHDGLAAVEAARAQHFDVVLCDIGLPRLDGHGVARRMRGELGMTGSLLVAMTGYGQDEDKQQSAAAGFDAHLVKPVDPEELNQVLAGWRHGSGADRGVQVE